MDTSTSTQTQGIDRRAFLKSGTAAIAAFSLAPQLAGAAETTAPAAAASDALDPVRQVRIGVVGGRFGLQFYWHEHPNCTVAGVSDLRPERLKQLSKTYRCDATYPSLEEMIKARDVEAVALFTGAPDHVRHAVACLNAGKHVISAVPAGLSIEECEELLDAVKRTGLTYMMAETSWYHQSVITARQWYDEGKFGNIIYCEAEYLHPGLEELYVEDGQKTWRYGFPPMLYPTHCTGLLVGVTSERLTSVSCTGWGDDSPFLKDNQYKNPFWNETAMFQTEKGHSFRVLVWWKGPVGGGERADWYGEKISFFNQTLNGLGPIVRRDAEAIEKDDAGFERKVVKYEKWDQPQHWKTDMLPEPLRHPSGHDGSHTFLTHEFIDALVNNRRPAIDIYESLAMTVPGIVAHQSALQGGSTLKIPVYERPS
jgi:predicted dehydrogenase